MYITRSLVGTFRSSAKYFSKKDEALSLFYPEPFPHWQRNEKQFSFVNATERTAITFHPNKFVLKSECHETTGKYDDAVPMLKELLELFEVTEFRSMQVASIRTHELSVLRTARSGFADRFLASGGENLMKRDSRTDYKVTIQRRWRGHNDDFGKVDDDGPLNMDHVLHIGPVEKEEIGARWLEFKPDAENDLYKTEFLPAPSVAILADMKLSFRETRDTEWENADTVSRFVDWAEAKLAETWSAVETEIEK